METETILHTALFSGILGFFAFCASYAFHVWRSRNTANRRDRQLAPGGRLLRWSVLSVGLGCVLLLVSVIWREVKPREGVLSGEGLYTVRAEKDLKLEYVSPARTVEPGEVLARFCSPERRAEMTELDLKRQILETQRKVIELQPLTPDSELVRNHEKCVADQRQLLASMSYMIPEHALVVREKLRDKLDKTERFNALNTRMDSARRELEQAKARRTLAEKHVNRMRSLSEDKAAAQIELDEHATNLSVAQEEVGKLQASLADLETERKHIQDGMPLFAACTSQQAEDINREIVRVREQLADSGKELQASQERLNADRRRAELLKAQMLAQLDLEIRQYQARREGIQDVLTIRAPFEGLVAYADPAPGAALPTAPVAILTPEQGFRFRLRMTEAEVGPLSQAESVPLGLVAPVLQRRFPGKLVKWERLPHESGYVLAELACMPPPETIRELAAHDWGTRDWLQVPTMKVRLLWRPPIHVLPMFFPAVCIAAVGLIGLCTAWLTKSRRNPLSGHEDAPSLTGGHSSGQPADLPPELTVPWPTAGFGLDAAEVESGAVGRNLQMLGQRFREAIKRQCIEPSLLRALEWTIDRHHTRALKHLMTGLDHDPTLPSSLEHWQRQAASESERSTGENDQSASRVIRIVEAVAPELLNRRKPPEAALGTAVDVPTALSMPSTAPSSQRGMFKSTSR